MNAGPLSTVISSGKSLRQVNRSRAVHTCMQFRGMYYKTEISPAVAVQHFENTKKTIVVEIIGHEIHPVTTGLSLIILVYNQVIQFFQLTYK